jgi:glutamate racemase
MDNRPIGIFDSGIGGLTVVREVLRWTPCEPIVYFGDTARVPYGTKSAKVVQTFAFQDTRFLLKHDVKMIVVACHTVSSIALKCLQNAFPVPILGVVEPGVTAALAATRNNRIGVIGTKGTVLSGAYEKSISEKRKGMTVITQACPLFVPLVEEGWLEEGVTVQIAQRYLSPLKKKGIDTLVLGCTHYPLLKPVLQEIMGKEVVLIDSAEETAKAIKERLAKDKMESAVTDNPESHFFVSDIPHHFRKVGALCLGRTLRNVTQVDIEAMDMDTQKDLAKRAKMRYIKNLNFK